MKIFWNFLSLIIFGSYTVYLFAVGKLLFFIHPRYEWLTTAAGLVLIVTGILGVTLNRKSIVIKKTSFKSFDFVICVLIFCLFLVPVKTLSSESFSLRSSAQSTKLSQNQVQDLKKKFTGNVDSSSFTMYDWVTAKNLKDNAIFNGKQFKGSGFVSKAGDSSMFNVSRFVISCCVVDATPASLLVKYDWENEYKVDDWVELTGTFEIKSVDGKPQPIIIPKTITKIQQPKNSYLNQN